jgi:hypothetical protein
VNRKEIEELTGLYVDAGIGTKKELYRRVKKDPSGAARLDSRCLFPGEPNQSF